MKKTLLATALIGFLFVLETNAQVCCNVVDGSGLKVVTTNGLCVIAPNLVASASCADDADGDGVKDAVDKCPHESGPVENNGCPELSTEETSILKDALEGVQFKTDSDELVGDSNAKLDQVVALLNKHEDFKLKISGYTDNTGDPAYNVDLSDKRAHAAESYIVSKGIDASRVSAKGYGAENPIADNDSAEGRAKNRRVEFEIVFD
ncbi:MAG: OmpA family protein [Cyclobacteriaceae bacterium]